jgi:hypothetical protein
MGLFHGSTLRKYETKSHYYNMSIHISDSDLSSLGGANCLLSLDLVQGSRGAFCGG